MSFHCGDLPIYIFTIIGDELEFIPSYCNKIAAYTLFHCNYISAYISPH